MFFNLFFGVYERNSLRRIILHDSGVEKYGYRELLDYQMSEKFGTNWKKIDAKRVQVLIEIMTLKAKRKEVENKKAEQKSKQKKYGRH